jgi:hypothetical protein
MYTTTTREFVHGAVEMARCWHITTKNTISFANTFLLQYKTDQRIHESMLFIKHFCALEIKITPWKSSLIEQDTKKIGPFIHQSQNLARVHWLIDLLASEFVYPF